MNFPKLVLSLSLFAIINITHAMEMDNANNNNNNIQPKKLSVKKLRPTALVEELTKKRIVAIQRWHVQNQYNKSYAVILDDGSVCSAAMEHGWAKYTYLDLCAVYNTTKLMSQSSTSQQSQSETESKINQFLFNVVQPSHDKNCLVLKKLENMLQESDEKSIIKQKKGQTLKIQVPLNN